MKLNFVLFYSVVVLSYSYYFFLPTDTHRIFLGRSCYKTRFTHMVSSNQKALLKKYKKTLLKIGLTFCLVRRAKGFTAVGERRKAFGSPSISRILKEINKKKKKKKKKNNR
jgi:hypothetical protein